LLATVASVIDTSDDAGDAAAVSVHGATEAARRLLEAPPKWGCSYEPDWWELLTVHGDVAGFVLPATYDDSRRAGRDEATIFHMGVLPTLRGRGFGRLLLQRATEVLMDHGVWRIFCDTAETNHAMIHLFETSGWTRLETGEASLARRATL
jgi:ribosomal protein S18 acetylase RimI-like enzyme